MTEAFTEGVHYYFDEKGLMVLTGRYLLSRGECCGSGCRHCPYNYINVRPPMEQERLRKERALRNNKGH